MKEDYFIIYEGDEEIYEDGDEDATGTQPATRQEENPEFRELPSHLASARERRQRAMEVKERRRLERLARSEEKRKAREAEFEQRANEYQSKKEARHKQKEERSAAHRRD